MKDIAISVYFVDKDNNKINIKNANLDKRYYDIIKEYAKYIDGEIVLND